MLQGGQLVQQGAAAEVYRKPANSYCASLLGSVQLLSPPVAAAMSGVSVADIHAAVFVRPEWIELSDNKGIPGVVTQVLFCGNFYLLHVTCAGEEVQVQVQKNPPSPGETLWLTADAADFWYW
jgi:ABC-type sugar transport system ATPase subunit